MDPYSGHIVQVASYGMVYVTSKYTIKHGNEYEYNLYVSFVYIPQLRQSVCLESPRSSDPSSKSLVPVPTNGIPISAIGKLLLLGSQTPLRHMRLSFSRTPWFNTTYAFMTLCEGAMKSKICVGGRGYGNTHSDTVVSTVWNKGKWRIMRISVAKNLEPRLLSMSRFS
jgi:hypothetical protein